MFKDLVDEMEEIFYTLVNITACGVLVVSRNSFEKHCEVGTGCLLHQIIPASIIQQLILAGLIITALDGFQDVKVD
jgi:hypothetical protein